MKAVVTSQDSHIPPFIAYQQNGQQRRQLPDNSESKGRQIAGPTEYNDYTSWEHIFSQIWKKSPFGKIKYSFY